MMVRSMTAFGHGRGSAEGWIWDWELRSVNGRGLDLKFRLPDLIHPLEPNLRKLAGAALGRGNVTATLQLKRSTDRPQGQIDQAALAQQLELIRGLNAECEAAGVTLAPMSQAEALQLPGIVSGEADSAEQIRAALSPALNESFEAALAALIAMRQSEGQALADLMTALLDQVEAGRTAAEAMAPERATHQRRVLEAALERARGSSDQIEPDRLAQEIALIAVKGDVTEELDRLRVHVAAARQLLQKEGPIGRKFDFLTQEFNREANTLCSKSQYGPLTQIGLDLKAAIDQMREQVQNLE